MKGLFKSKLIKKDGSLSYSSGDPSLYNEFVKELPEGTQLSITIEVLGKEKSLNQLALVHSYIRILAEHSGNSFGAVKDEIKDKAGLVEISEEETSSKSFADCSTDELSLAIQACIDLGDFLGVNLR